MAIRLLTGDVRAMLATLEDASVQCVVTSPPYFGLRSYGSEPQLWGGDDPDCEHEWQTERRYVEGGGNQRSSEAFHAPGEMNAARLKATRWKQDDTCSRCGAWRGELGQEKTLSDFIAHLVEVFRAVRRVLRPDGVCFVNLGDSYNAGRDGGHPGGKAQWKDDRYPNRSGANVPGLKPKDLMMVPSRLAIALQDDGWYLRSMMPWVKRNCMPESAQDRPTSAVEYVFMLTRSPRYFWDAEAVKRSQSVGTLERFADGRAPRRPTGPKHDGVMDPFVNTADATGGLGVLPSGRNFRNSDIFFDSLGLLLDGDGAYISDKEDNSTPNQGMDAENISSLESIGLAIDGNPAPTPKPARRSPLSWEERKARGEAMRRGTTPGKMHHSGGIGATVDAGPDFDSMGLILDEDGDPLALDVNPAPLKLAHFASFPPKLVAPLIKGATSEKGCCSSCGAPWVRVMDEIKPEPKYVTGKNVHNEDRNDKGRTMFVGGSTATVGWEPTCSCDADDPIPCTVLDPFAGAGTTLLVADRLGRDAVGIELSSEYAEMARQRITGDAPLFAHVEVA